ncbi:MAG: AsmA family protein [Bacteroidales bacterium]|jgi:hypothetical protein|nr:AsmA family protein [Bacteroidales bacterium]
MKKALKIIGITLLSIIGVLLIVICIVFWLALTPKRITPIVNNQVEKFINAETKLGEIDLTLFRTFPKAGIKINNLFIINPVEGSPSDTLVYVESCILSFNLKEFLKNDVLNVDNIYLENGFANIFINCDNQSNFDIFNTSSEETEDSGEFKMPFVEYLLEKLYIKNLNVLYEDCPNHLSAELNNFSTNSHVQGNDSRIDGKIDISTDNIYFSYNESDSSNINAVLSKSKFIIDGVYKDNILEGSMQANFPETSLKMDNVDYLNSSTMSLNFPFYLDFNRKHFDIKQLILNFEENIITLKGTTDLNYNNTDDILVNVDFGTSKLIIENILPLIPKPFLNLLEGIDVGGAITIDGSVNGIFNENLMPKIKINALYDEGKFSYSGLDYNFRDVYAKLSADIDISDNLKYDANIEKLSAKTLSSSFDISGKVTDTTGNIFCNLKLNSNLNLPDAQRMIPEDMTIEMSGKAKLSANARFKLDDVLNMNLMKTSISGRVILSDLDVFYEDSIKLVSPNLDILFAIPNQAKNLSFKELIRADIVSSGIIADISDNIHADLKDINLTVGVSNILDTIQPVSVKGSFEMSKIIASMDTINANISDAIGSFSMIPSKENREIVNYNVEYFSNDLNANMGSTYKIRTAAVGIKASAKYDEKQKNILLQWNPEFDFDISEGKIEIPDIEYPIFVPNLKMDYDSKVFNIHDGNFVIGNSAFHLKGDVKNVDGYLRDSTLLTAVFDFTSDNTDVNQLMDLVNGFGADSTDINDVELESPEDNPFMVPKGIDFRLNTLIKKATIGETVLESLGGHVTVKDGVLVLEEMGFTTRAARMELTAMYRSQRKNHLFVGFDLRLLDIDIEELIDIIPYVDSILPMLKSFKGNAEFYLDAETYLTSAYKPKMSTLRASSSITGKNLVLLDSDVFSQISKLLMFSKKTENLVDSVAVELTVFKDEVDLYPFLISIDKYQAVVAGRHNIDKDFSCDYHISITDTPLPIRLGLEVSGPVSDLKFKLVPTQYANLYNPKKRNVVQAQTLRLQQMIRDSLRDNLK